MTPWGLWLHEIPLPCVPDPCPWMPTPPAARQPARPALIGVAAAPPRQCPCHCPCHSLPMPMPMTPGRPVMANWPGVAGNGRRRRPCSHRTLSGDYNSSLPLRTLLVCLVLSAYHPSVFNQTRSVILHILRDRVLPLFTIRYLYLPVCESPRAPDALRPFPACCWCCYFRVDNLLCCTYLSSFLPWSLRLLAAPFASPRRFRPGRRPRRPSSTQLIQHVSWLSLPLTFTPLFATSLLSTRDLGRLTGHCSKSVIPVRLCVCLSVPGDQISPLLRSRHRAP